MTLYCQKCGSLMIKDKINHYDKDSGNPEWLMKCPKKTFFSRNHSQFFESTGQAPLFAP